VKELFAMLQEPDPPEEGGRAEAEPRRESLFKVKKINP
jgi:hypothetical protein